MVRKSKKAKTHPRLKSKDIETWRVAELVAAKVELEERIKEGIWHNSELERAKKRLQDLQDELNRRRRAGLL
jgi:hypothetical protein